MEEYYKPDLNYGWEGGKILLNESIPNKSDGNFGGRRKC